MAASRCHVRLPKRADGTPAVTMVRASEFSLKACGMIACSIAIPAPSQHVHLSHVVTTNTTHEDGIASEGTTVPSGLGFFDAAQCATVADGKCTTTSLETVTLVVSATIPEGPITSTMGAIFLTPHGCANCTPPEPSTVRAGGRFISDWPAMLDACGASDMQLVLGVTVPRRHEGAS